MDGPSTILVDPASAVHAQECRKSRVESLPINRAHSYMVKYSPQDQEYQTVARNLSYLIHTEKDDSYVPEIVASFFFHGRGSEIVKTPVGLFRSLLRQILPYFPQELAKLENISQERQLSSDGKWAWKLIMLQNIFEEIVPKASAIHPIVFYVDALDEIGEDSAVKLVKYFKRLVYKSAENGGRLSICFSCRHYPIVSLDCELQVC